MSVEHLEVIVEEPSMEAFLALVLPKIVGPLPFQIVPHQCKTELLDVLPKRLMGYRKWLPESWRILVVVDRDRDDCLELKRKLDGMAKKAGLGVRKPKGKLPWAVVNRIAIEELEAWYFGDWEAVRAAYPKASPTITAKQQYRDSDAIRGGTWEAFERVMQDAGYFEGGLRKIEAARAIAEHVVPERNTSPSFQAVHSVLAALAVAS